MTRSQLSVSEQLHGGKAHRVGLPDGSLRGLIACRAATAVLRLAEPNSAGDHSREVVVPVPVQDPEPAKDPESQMLASQPSDEQDTQQAALRTEASYTQSS